MTPTKIKVFSCLMSSKTNRTKQNRREKIVFKPLMRRDIAQHDGIFSYALIRVSSQRFDGKWFSKSQARIIKSCSWPTLSSLHWSERVPCKKSWISIAAIIFYDGKTMTCEILVLGKSWYISYRSM